MSNAIKKPDFHLGYLPALDGLRGISVLSVMLVHGGLFFLGQGGFLGVDIFFTLSGFLITALLVEEWQQSKTISFKNFYARRALRLLPALFLVIISCLAVIIISPPAIGILPAARSVLVALFYLANWLPVYPPLFHTWSLGIEEQFYIVWPLVLFVLLRLRFSYRFIIFFLIAGVVLLNVNRAILWYHHTDANLLRVYVSLDTRSDTLLIGCIAGILVSRGLIQPDGRALPLIRGLTVVSVVVMALMILAIPSVSPVLYYGGFSAVGVMVAVIITSLFYAPVTFLKWMFELPLLRWFGRLSYGLYLWHLPIYSLYSHVAPRFTFKSYTLRIMLPFMIEFLLSVGVASLSFYLIERRVLRLKSRFKSKSKPRDLVSLPFALPVSVEPP